MPLDFHYTPEHLTNQAARLGQIFGIEDAAHKISPDGFHIETLSPNVATITVTMQRHVNVDEALRLLQATPIEEKPFLTGTRIRIPADATPGELRGAITKGAIHPDDFRAWLDKNDAALVDATRARQAAEIRLLIHDLDNARADGTVITYGHIQRRLRAVLGDPGTDTPDSDSARRGESEAS